MGNSYEYLITSLPFLQLNVSPKINLVELNRLVSENVSDSVYKKFQKADFWMQDFCPTSTAVAVRDFRKNLIIEIAEIRRAKFNNRAIVTAILSNDFISMNPMEAELEINKTLWDKMNELIFEHNFDFSEILIYKFKLQLLERQFSFVADKGMDKVKALILSSKNKEE